MYYCGLYLKITRFVCENCVIKGAEAMCYLIFMDDAHFSFFFKLVLRSKISQTRNIR